MIKKVLKKLERLKEEKTKLIAFQTETQKKIDDVDIKIKDYSTLKKDYEKLEKKYNALVSPTEKNDE